jgi:DNA polymerase-4
MDKTILHCDLNNFYASVEQKTHPEYDGMPLAVCGNPKMRHGIILAKNQLAKSMGVATGEAIWEAQRKCPDLVLVPPHFDEYVKYSEQMFSIYTQYTDRVESFGIDECWLDVSGSLNLFGSGREIADKLREEVKKKTGLTISVGVSFTKVLAKLGSDLKKPDATTVLARADYMDIVGNLEPSELIMIGKKTAKKLETLNIRTIRQLAAANADMLRQKFGIIADNMIAAARGEEKDEIKRYYDVHIPKSVSNGTTTPRNIENLEDAKVVVYALSELIAMRLRQYNLVAAGISLSIKDQYLETVSKQRALDHLTAHADDLAEAAIDLLLKMHTFSQPLRAITIGAIRLSDKSEIQLSFFDDDYKKDETLDAAVDKIRTKYGYQSLKRGVLLENDLALNLHEEDGFRPFKKN